MGAPAQVPTGFVETEAGHFAEAAAVGVAGASTEVLELVGTRCAC